MKITPGYFRHIPTNQVYACCGTDEGYYWAENPTDSFELLKFDPCDCEPLSEEELKQKEYFDSLYGKVNVAKLSNGTSQSETSANG